MVEAGFRYSHALLLREVRLWAVLTCLWVTQATRNTCTAYRHVRALHGPPLVIYCRQYDRVWDEDLWYFRTNRWVRRSGI